MHGDSGDVSAPVITNVDPNELSKSPLVRAFMFRIVDSLRDPLTGAVFVTSLADRAADAFDLYLSDGALPDALLNVAAQVIALENASRRATARTNR